MYNSVPTAHHDNLEILVVSLIALLVILWQWYIRNTPSKISSDESLIISMYAYGAMLMPVTKGVLGEYPYYLMVSQNQTELPGDEQPLLVGSVVMTLELPFASPAHIAGFGLQDQSFKQALGNSSVDNSLKKVELEGDFPDYFRIYCEPDKEIELREVLNPSTMAFLVDFCKRMQWEIVGKSLYFAQSSKPTSPGSETVVGDATEFVQKILPEIQKIKADDA